MRVAIAMIACLIGPQAWAATRTVQFAGMVEMQPTQDVTINAAATVKCRVAVVNTGGTNQDLVNADFVEFSSQTGLTTYPVGPTTSDRFDPSTNNGTSCGTGTPLSGGSSTSLPPGGMCIFYFNQQAVSSQSKLGVCAGRVTVKDTDPSTPGSVIATGDIGHTQEMLLLGGVMSGALYLSGLHYWSSTAYQTQYDGFSYAPQGSTGFNMNAYCLAACYDSRAENTPTTSTGKYCSAHCGYSGLWEPNTGHPRGSLFQIYNADPTTGYATGDPAMIAVPANSHLSGGMVLEMIMGPMTSICTANAQSWSRGAQDFSHPGGFDPYYLGRAGTTAGSYGPVERLFCQHRHAMEDFFFGGSQSIPIVINGGNPF